MPPISLPARMTVVAIGLVVAACSGSTPTPAPTAAPTVAPTAAPATPEATTSPKPAPTDAPTASPTEAPAESPSVAPSASAAPVAQTAVLDGTLYFMGYEIALTDASYDPAVGLHIGANFKNTSTAPASLYGITDGGKATVTWNGQVTALGIDSSLGVDVPGGSTIPGAFKGSPPEGFTLADAVLTLGLSDQHQSSLPLAVGGTATTEFPRTFPVTGSVKIGNMGRVIFNGGEVANVTCSGHPDQVSFGPAKLTDQTILLHVTETDPNHQWDTIVNSWVTAPDGTTTNGSPGGRYMSGGTTFRGDLLCYTVGAPVAGHYVSHWTAERTKKKGKFAFDVPAQ